MELPYDAGPAILKSHASASEKSGSLGESCLKVVQLA